MHAVQRGKFTELLVGLLLADWGRKMEGALGRKGGAVQAATAAAEACGARVVRGAMPDHPLQHGILSC